MELVGFNADPKRKCNENLEEGETKIMGDFVDLTKMEKIKEKQY